MWAGLKDVVANFLGYSLGILVSFFVNRNWTFRHRGPVGHAAPRFVISVIVAYVGNLTALLMLRDVFGVSVWIAQALAVGPYAVILYVLSSRFVFARSSDARSRGDR